MSTLCSFHFNDLGFQEDHWVWDSNNIPFSYTNWDSEQPNNYGEGQDCLRIHKSDKKWDDTMCDDTNYSKPLCQIISGEFHSCFFCFVIWVFNLGLLL